jgi:hypothetical protein
MRTFTVRLLSGLAAVAASTVGFAAPGASAAPANAHKAPLTAPLGSTKGSFGDTPGLSGGDMLFYGDAYDNEMG